MNILKKWKRGLLNGFPIEQVRIVNPDDLPVKLVAGRTFSYDNNPTTKERVNQNFDEVIKLGIPDMQALSDYFIIYLSADQKTQSSNEKSLETITTS